MEPFAHDVDELKRMLDALGEAAFERAYIDYCVALLEEEEPSDLTRAAA